MEYQDGRPKIDETPQIGATTYQMTLAGLALPLKWHILADALGAVCLAMVGHPVVGGLAFIGYCVMDILHTQLIGRWLREAGTIDAQAGLRRLSALCAARIGVYVAPVAFVALDGHTPELFLFGLQAATLLTTAMAAGVLSRPVFWSLAAPVLLA